MGGHGKRRGEWPVAVWLMAIGAILLVAPELIWLPLLVAAVFLGTRESCQTSLAVEP
jgi:hypothetical protein